MCDCKCGLLPLAGESWERSWHESLRLRHAGCKRACRGNTRTASGCDGMRQTRDSKPWERQLKSSNAPPFHIVLTVCLFHSPHNCLVLNAARSHPPPDSPLLLLKSTDGQTFPHSPPRPRAEHIVPLSLSLTSAYAPDFTRKNFSPNFFTPLTHTTSTPADHVFLVNGLSQHRDPQETGKQDAVRTSTSDEADYGEETTCAH